MITYADLAAVEAFLAAGDYMSAEMPGTVADREAIVRAAEDDVDRILGFTLTRNATTGRKLDPSALTVAQRAALERAVCAQVAWRLEAGDEALLGFDSDVTAVSGLSVGPQPRPPSPAAVEALSGQGFKWRSGTVAPEPPCDTPQLL